jgi:internalin A
MATLALVDLQQLGTLLKDAADAVTKFADSIAHIVKLGDAGLTEMSARRAHARLLGTYRGIGQLSLTQGVVKNRFELIVDFLPGTGPDSEFWPAEEKDWKDATSEIKPLIEQVDHLLSDLRNERSDFVLEPAYRSLHHALHGRHELFARLRASDLPKTPEQVKAVRLAVLEWNRLINELREASDAMAAYLKDASRQRSTVQETPKMSEWYVSYAWGDNSTPEGHAREEIVDRLCAAAAAQGHRILRDKDVLNLGDRISNFMKRIGRGDRVFVILSDKYLHSPYCMFELSEIWRTSKQEGEEFLKRVRIYALPDAKIFRPEDWADWAIYWKREHDALESRAQQHGIVVLGEQGHRRLTQMRNLYNQVADILGNLADIVQPSTFEDLERYGFNDLLDEAGTSQPLQKF